MIVTWGHFLRWDSSRSASINHYHFFEGCHILIALVHLILRWSIPEGFDVHPNPNWSFRIWACRYIWTVSAEEIKSMRPVISPVELSRGIGSANYCRVHICKQCMRCLQHAADMVWHFAWHVQLAGVCWLHCPAFYIFAIITLEKCKGVKQELFQKFFLSFLSISCSSLLISNMSK